MKYFYGDLPALLKSFFNAGLNRGKLSHGDPFGILVSGGVDSMVLLDCLSRIRGEFNFHFSVFHFNHHLRGEESDGDEKLVNSEAKRLDFPIFNFDLHFEKGVKNLQSRARKERLQVLACAPQKGFISAHHQGDQIEQFFLNWMQKDPLTGTFGMDRVQNLLGKIFLKPLLKCPKLDLIRWAKQHQIPFRNDSSNLNNPYRRNQIRNEILPRLTNLDPQFPQRVLQLQKRLKREKPVVLNHPKIRVWDQSFKVFPGGAIPLIKSLIYNFFPQFRPRSGFWRSLYKKKKWEGLRIELSRGGALHFYKGRCYLVSNPPPQVSLKIQSLPGGWQQTGGFAWKFSNTPPERGRGVLMIQGSTGKLLENSQVPPFFKVTLINGEVLWELGGGKKGPSPRIKLKKFFQKGEIPPHLRPFFPIFWIDEIPLSCGIINLYEKYKPDKSLFNGFFLVKKVLNYPCLPSTPLI